MFSLPPPPKRKNKGAQGSMLITLTTVMVSWVYACDLTHQIIYVKICAVFVYQLYFRKSEEKEEKGRKGRRKREKEGKSRPQMGTGWEMLLSSLVLKGENSLPSRTAVFFLSFLHSSSFPSSLPLFLPSFLPSLQLAALMFKVLVTQSCPTLRPHGL